MEPVLIAPANYSFLGIPTLLFSFLIPIAGMALFTYIMAIRIAPLVLAAPDFRFNRFGERIVKVLRIWLLQWRQPRYKTAGWFSGAEYPFHIAGHYRYFRRLCTAGPGRAPGGCLQPF